MTDNPKAEVVSLKAVPKEVKQATLQPIEDIVNFFEEKLALAKEGKIVAFSSITLEQYDYEGPVTPAPAIYATTIEDVSMLKMTQEVAVDNELKYLWAVYMNYGGVDE